MAISTKDTSATMTAPPCRLCGSPTSQIGDKYSAFSRRQYSICHCSSCHFSFVADPWTEFAKIYSEEYYEGRGADPSVDFVFELEHPDQTIREYEWAGVLRVVNSLVNLGPGTRWLDFGCGNGGLVRYVREHSGCQMVGFEEGWIRGKAVATGIPYLEREQLDNCNETFDVITAIEVIEHIVYPLDVLKYICRLLKPGGLFFFTTGNAKRFRNRLLHWSYVVPDVHVSFYEPTTLGRALTIAGFQPEFRGFIPGFDDIIRFKVLKALQVQRRSRIERTLPWKLLSHVVDARFSVTAHPIGWKK
jgi:SAM-dependent methyltransferase